MPKWFGKKSSGQAAQRGPGTAQKTQSVPVPKRSQDFKQASFFSGGVLIV